MGLISKLFGGNNTNNNLQGIIEDGAFLVDVRTAEEFNSGHAKGSVNIPLDKIGQEINKFKGKKNIVVFCRSGNRSGQAKSILEQNGFSNVINGGTWRDVAQLIQ